MTDVTYKVPIAEEATSATLRHFCPRAPATPFGKKKPASGEYRTETGQFLRVVMADDSKVNVLSTVEHHVVERDVEHIGPCARCGVEFNLTWARNCVDVEMTLPVPEFV